MPSVIKTGRKRAAPKAAAGAAPEPTAEDATSTDMVAVAEAPAPAVQAAAPARRYAAPTYDPNATYTPPSGASDFQLPARFYPAEPAPLPEPNTGSGSIIERALLFSGEQSAADRDRQAQADWEAAMAPVMELMKQFVPDAATPQEAERILAENQGAITPDPNGGSYIAGDAFTDDARVYYRLLRRDYEKTPRPSEVGKRPLSHHLHTLHGKLTGVKGW